LANIYERNLFLINVNNKEFFLYVDSVSIEYSYFIETWIRQQKRYPIKFFANFTQKRSTWVYKIFAKFSILDTVSWQAKP